MTIHDRDFDPEAARMRSDRPRRRGRDRDEDDEDVLPAKGGGGALPLILVLGGAGALLLVLLACGSCLFFLPWQFTPNPPPVAINDPPRNGWGNGGPPPDAVPPPAPHEVPKPDPQPAPQNDPPRKPPQVPKNEPPPPPPPPPPVRWQVKPDSLPAGLTLADKPEGSIPITGYPPGPNNLVDQVVFPTSASPFVSVAVKGPIHDAHEVWDLRTMKRVGVTVEPKHPFTEAFLSPDGAWWAKPSFFLESPGGVDFYDVADGRLYHLTVADKNAWVLNIDFGGPGQAVTLIDVAGKGELALLVQVWDIKKRSEVRQFVAPANRDANQRSISPGRRYIALVRRDNTRVLLYDLTGGELSGELSLPAGSACQGLSFAADGKSLAGLVKAGGATRLLAWDLATGKKTADYKFDKDPVANVGAIRGPAIEWLPKGGWLLYGQVLVDGQSGAVYWRIPVEGADGTQPRHVFGDGQLAYVKVGGPAAGADARDNPPARGRGGRGGRGTKSLAFEPLPADEVAKALKAVRSGH